jgi:hypothetical protein
MDKDYSQNTKSTTMSIAVIAIVAALALLGVVVVTVVTISQEAEARGCNLGQQLQFNASKGRCFHPD